MALWSSNYKMIGLQDNRNSAESALGAAGGFGDWMDYRL